MQPLARGMLAHLVLVHNPAHNPEGDFALNGSRLSNPGPTDDTYTYSGIGLFHPDLFAGQQTGSAFSVTPLIRSACDQGKITAQLHQGNWDDVGTPERLGELNPDQFGF